MTKYEWERQLKRGISTLPKSEQRRVLDYYNELFADKVELRMHEEDIIAEFGNPYDVANRLIVDFYNENGDERNVDIDPPMPPKRRQKRVDDDDDFFDDDVRFERSASRNRHKNRRDEQYDYDRQDRRDTRKRAEMDDLDEFFEATDVPYRGRTQSQQKRQPAPQKAQQSISSSDKKKIQKADGVIWGGATLMFFILGAFFDMWHPAWMLFLGAIIVCSIVSASVYKSMTHFNYPVTATLLFLLLGFESNMWHPAWILFVTIPFYYAIVGGGKKKQKEQQQDDEQDFVYQSSNRNPRNQRVEDRPIQHQPRGKATFGSVFGAVVLAMLFVWLTIALWSTAIGLFAAGISMLAAGVLTLIVGASQFVAGATFGMAILGAALVVFGLGLIFVVGVASLFKALAKATNGMFSLVGKVANGGTK